MVGTWVGVVRVSWMVFQDCFLGVGGLRVTMMIFRDGFLGWA